MQEIENNASPEQAIEKTLSIRIEADGLSFSCDAFPGSQPDGFYPADYKRTTPKGILAGMIGTGMLSKEAYPKIILEVDTPKTVLVPATVFEPGMEAGYIAANNLGCGKEERIVVARCGDIVAILIVRHDVVELLQNIWGEELSFRSPVCTILPDAETQNRVAINLTRRQAYITVTREGLEYADVLPYSTPADLLYYLEKLDQTYGIQQLPIRLTGEADKTVFKKIKRYYRNIL